MDSDDRTIPNADAKMSMSPVSEASRLADKLCTSASISPPKSNAIATPSSPPQFISFDKFIDTANSLYDMNLVHEITVDSEFKFEMLQPEDNLTKQVKEAMHKAFWDILRTSLESDPVDYSQAIRLLEEARESLLGLLTNTQNDRFLRAHIEAQLNLELAKTRLAESGVLDLEGYGKVVIDLMAKMCAPARDEEVAALREMTDPIEVFKQAFKVLDLMRMDMANYTISKMRSTIRQQAVQFEKEKFAEILETQRQSGFDGLSATKSWLKNAHDRLIEKISQENKSQSQDRSNIPVPNLILAEAYIMLLNIRNELEFPETLMMDKDRLSKLMNRLTVLVCLASLILITCTHLSQHFTLRIAHASVSRENSLNESPSTSQWELLKLTLKDHCRNLISLHMEEGLKSGKGANLLELSSLSDVIHTQIIRDITKWLKDCSADLQPQLNASEMDEKIQSISTELSSHLRQILQFKHPVYVTLYEKAHNFLRLTLQSNAPSSMQVPPGFGMFQNRPQSSAAITPDRLQTGLNVPGIVHKESPQSKEMPGININYDAIRTQLQPYEMDSLVAIATVILPITTHNKFVHGNHYADIIQHFYALDQRIEAESGQKNPEIGQ